MDAAYDARFSPRLAVSTVIFALRDTPEGPALHLPLVRRQRAPHEGLWALPGGPLGAAEGLAEAAARTLHDTTALSPRYLEQLYAFGEPDRAPDASPRVVSIVYWALVRADEADALSNDPNVRWFAADRLDTLGPLAFDHGIIVSYALRRLRQKVEYSRIAQAFLGETFTAAQLRGVHEAIRGRRLDPANFRRQIEADPQLVATEKRLSGGRHRPPRLYRFLGSEPFAPPGPLDERGMPETCSARLHTPVRPGADPNFDAEQDIA